MKTITLTDDQFDTLFEFVDQKVECIAEASYLDSEILEEWEDLLDVHTVLEEARELARANINSFPVEEEYTGEWIIETIEEL